MANNSIQINPKKPSELEFEVLIQGIDKSNIPAVRFVVMSDTGDLSFNCVKVEGEKDKWLAKIPALSHIKTDAAQFRVEVIVDDYFFTPAEGEITFITTPKVKFAAKNTPKPTVTASFTVKQSEDEKPEPEKKDKKKVTEDLQETTSGGGEITGRYAPTNALLKPEEDPTENGRMRGNTSVNDEYTDKDRLSLDTAEDLGSSITPNNGARAYQQEDGKPRKGKIMPSEEEEFNPKKIADEIMKDTIGKTKNPTTKGTLFKRDVSGKAIIKGLDSAKTIQTLKDNAKKVKDILKVG